MRIDVLVPDAPAAGLPRPSAPVSHGGFSALVEAAGAILERAGDAEARFAGGRGGLQEMVVERARADVALQIAATAAQRTAQSLQTLLGMQV